MRGVRGFLCAGLILATVSLMAQEHECMQDRKFEWGLSMSPLTPDEVVRGGGFEKTNPDTLYFSRSVDRKPVWQVGQWHSRYSLAHAALTKTSYGRTYANRGKTIALSRKGVLTLEIKTSLEYDAPRRDGQPWPHLLIQQDFCPLISLEDVKRLVVSFDLRLLYCKNMMKPGEYDPRFHTAHTPFYLSLRNVNPQSADYGKCLWMGIQSFDYRYERLRDFHEVTWDVGTVRYIYQMPPRKLWGDIRFADCCWHHLEADIVPHLQEAIRNLHERELFQDNQLGRLLRGGNEFRLGSARHF